MYFKYDCYLFPRICLSCDLGAGSCFKRVFTWRSYSKYIYNGWCSSASYPTWASKRPSSTGLLTTKIELLCLSLFSIKRKKLHFKKKGKTRLSFVYMGSFVHKLEHVIILWHLLYAGSTLQSNFKSFFLYMDAWASSAGHSPASSYWQGRWSVCFTSCGKATRKFSSFPAYF
jgi:hypothetical protein